MIKIKIRALLAFLLLPTFVCASEIKTHQGMSLLGSPLFSNPLDKKRQAKQFSNYQKAFAAYNNDPNNIENIIWLGRRIAYLGDYQKAIDIFSEGIEKNPQDARLFRHRGHRYISTRQLDKAIVDFEKAAQLIKGQKDTVEPDGIPNAQNTPVSSLHSNIWYHLGLAYFLKGNLEKAENAFDQCIMVNKNNDNLVSASHWAYMIAREKKDISKAKQILDAITDDVTVIENFAYLKLLKFYKSKITEAELLSENSEALATSEAILFGVGNWYLYNGFTDKANEYFDHTLSSGHWAAFGYIAAESKLAKMRLNN